MMRIIGVAADPEPGGRTSTAGAAVLNDARATSPADLGRPRLFLLVMRGVAVVGQSLRPYLIWVCC
jgi:hypothetical protein